MSGAELGMRSPFLRVVELPLEGDAIAKSLACRKHEGATVVFAKFGTFGLRMLRRQTDG